MKIIDELIRSELRKKYLIRESLQKEGVSFQDKDNNQELLLSRKEFEKLSNKEASQYLLRFNIIYEIYLHRKPRNKFEYLKALLLGDKIERLIPSSDVENQHLDSIKNNSEDIWDLNFELFYSDVREISGVRRELLDRIARKFDGAKWLITILKKNKVTAKLFTTKKSDNSEVSRGKAFSLGNSLRMGDSPYKVDPSRSPRGGLASKVGRDGTSNKLKASEISQHYFNSKRRPQPFIHNVLLSYIAAIPRTLPVDSVTQLHLKNGDYDLSIAEGEYIMRNSEKKMIELPHGIFAKKILFMVLRESASQISYGFHSDLNSAGILNSDMFRLGSNQKEIYKLATLSEDSAKFDSQFHSIMSARFNGHPIGRYHPSKRNYRFQLFQPEIKHDNKYDRFTVPQRLNEILLELSSDGGLKKIKRHLKTNYQFDAFIYLLDRITRPDKENIKYFNWQDAYSLNGTGTSLEKFKKEYSHHKVIDSLKAMNIVDNVESYFIQDPNG